MNQTLEIAEGENAARSYDFRYTFGSALLKKVWTTLLRILILQTGQAQIEICKRAALKAKLD